ncbi:type VI secretion protein [Phenylobacterium sp. VNQ135]|uniref:type VI secretion protein n=1 Tax=Phenylobacterium sp. VNQ135 TaxID=3400922 RepID=UPI003C077626
MIVSDVSQRAAPFGCGGGPMLVREALELSEGARAPAARHAGSVRLPTQLKNDRLPVRSLMVQGLAASRLFAIGDRAGILRSAQRRSGRAFRMDVRQRVVVKALVSKHAGKGAARAAALLAHVHYLGRTGAGAEGAAAEFFNRTQSGIDAAGAAGAWAADRHHFRFIISPEHGDRIHDLAGYTREVMARVAADLGQAALEWVGTCHFDTDQPHAHVLIRGRKANGKDLVIPRDYVGYGFRARAQEVAQELLGDLSRTEAERRIWRETQANRFTGFDRRLLSAADDDRLVDDGVGAGEAWAALTRGRLRHLEALGLARRVGRKYRLGEEIETRLRALQLRQDVIRTLHQRRLETGAELRELRSGAVRGRIVQRGQHDEIGGVTWLVIRDRSGLEHYARLALGQTAPDLGRSVTLAADQRGARLLTSGKGLDRGL